MMTSCKLEPCLLMLSLNNPSHRKCIGFADYLVDIFLQKHVSSSDEIPGINMKFLITESNFENICSL